MARRSGVTLLEVLVAIFVMGIGLLALLTLFPLGALRVANAIQNDSCAALVANARAISTIKGMPWDAGVLPSYATLTWPTNPATTFQANNDYPSFPVFVDPIGFNSSTGLACKTNVAGGSGPATQLYSFVTRSTVSFVANLPRDTNQWFTRQDDIIFENAAVGTGNGPAGLPQLLLPGPYNQAPLFTPMTFSRDTRYSYALMCQLPLTLDTSVINTAVVVYNKRSVTPTQTFVSLPEYLCSATYSLANNTVTIDYTNIGTPPPARVGDWLMDNTLVPLANNTYTAHAGFYQIVGITDLGNNQIEFEVDTPLRGFSATMPANTIYSAIFLDGVAMVYYTGPQRLSP